MDAHTFDQARSVALSLVSYYSNYGGTLTKEVWGSGVITVEAIDYPKTVIFDPGNPIYVSHDENLAEIISIRRPSARG